LKDRENGCATLRYGANVLDVDVGADLVDESAHARYLQALIAGLRPECRTPLDFDCRIDDAVPAMPSPLRGRARAHASLMKNSTSCRKM